MPAKSKAKALQEASQQEADERRVRFMIVDDNAAEYHMEKPESVVRGILDPETPDAFIEVPIEPRMQASIKHHYLHTSRIAHLYLHDELTPDTPPTPESKGG